MEDVPFCTHLRYMKKEVKVLVVGSGNVTGMNVIRALFDIKGITLYGCDYDAVNPSNQWCDSFEVPRCAAEDYPEVIMRIIKEKSITHIIASNDHDVRALSILKSNVSNFPFLNGYTQNILACLDKKTTEKLFIEAGVETPLEISDNKDYPYVLRKESMGSNRKFVHIVKNQEDAKAIPEEHYAQGMMTRYVEGEEYTVDMICDSYSNVLAAVPRKRIIVMGGMVHHAQIVKEDKLIALCGQISKSVGLVGMSCIQCITDGEHYNFIEINPRPGSGIDLSIKGGINMPLLWIKDTLGEHVEVPSPKWGLQMKRYYSGYYFF